MKPNSGAFFSLPAIHVWCEQNCRKKIIFCSLFIPYIQWYAKKSAQWTWCEKVLTVGWRHFYFHLSKEACTSLVFFFFVPRSFICVGDLRPRSSAIVFLQLVWQCAAVPVPSSFRHGPAQMDTDGHSRKRSWVWERGDHGVSLAVFVILSAFVLWTQ